MTLSKRLDDLEEDLTPKELMITWIRETHEFPSMRDYARWLADQPDDSYPLVKMPHLAAEAVRRRHKGKKDGEIWSELLSAQRDVLFLFHLHSQVNEQVVAERAGLELRACMLHHVLKHLLFRVEVSEHFHYLWLHLADALPYPVDEETAAAITDAQRFQVWPWADIEKGALIQDWLEDELRREGKTELPVGAGLTRGDSVPYPYSLADHPTPEELRACFAGEESFGAFMAAEDFSFGFADVRDAEYERRCDALEAALKELVSTGEVEAGDFLRLDSIPHQSLAEASLLEGEWIDRRLLLLAEWGALLRKRHFRLDYAGDNHPLAWDRIYAPKGTTECQPDDPHLRAAMMETEDKLAGFPGRTRETLGRPYLSFSDYLAWPKRGVKGDLRKELKPGLLRESFNDWCERQEGEARLAGVKVEPITSYLDDYQAEVLSPSEAARKAWERRQLFADICRFPASFGFTHPETEEARKETNKFSEEAERWRVRHYELTLDLSALRVAERRLAHRYLGDEDLFWPELKEELDSTNTFLDQLAGLYRQAVEPEIIHTAEHERRGMTSDTSVSSPSPLEPKSDEVKRAAGKLAHKLMIQAKAETLQKLGDFGGASRLVRPFIFGEETR